MLSDEVPQSRNAGSILLRRLFAGYGLEARGEGKERRAKVKLGARPVGD
jgi:hypothetical protein